jgi:glucose-6-phosphate-specific signal transduction histidine kinase
MSIKRSKRLTRAEKQAKFKTIAAYLRSKEESTRKQAAKELDNEFSRID